MYNHKILLVLVSSPFLIIPKSIQVPRAPSCGECSNCRKRLYNNLQFRRLSVHVSTCTLPLNKTGKTSKSVKVDPVYSQSITYA